MSESAKRTFEFVEGSSNKFWEVWVDGAELTTRWGRIGTNGQSKTKSFASSDKAAVERDKLIAEKVGKGYRETISNADAAANADVALPPVIEPALTAIEESLDSASEDDMNAHL